MALAGLASSAVGAIGGAKAAKEQKKNWQAALKLAQGLRADSNRTFAGEMASIGHAEGALNQGFDMARKAAGRAGRSGVQDVMEGRKTTLATLKQQLLDSGHSPASGLYSNAVRGTSATATRQLTKVREMVAGIIGGVEMGRGAGLSDLNMQKAGAWGRNYDRMSSIAGGEIGVRSQYQPYSQSGAGGWGQFLGMLAPLLQSKGKGPHQMPGGGTAPNNYGPGYLGDQE